MNILRPGRWLLWIGKHVFQRGHDVMSRHVTSFSSSAWPPVFAYIGSHHSFPLRDLQYLHTLGHIILFFLRDFQYLHALGHVILFLYVTFSICIHWVTSFFSFYVTSSICLHWVTWFFSFTWPPVFACIGSHHAFPLRDLQYLHALGHIILFLCVTSSIYIHWVTSLTS